MSQDTRQKIIDYTIKLVEQKPINKIKIRDIVDGCGITRNTFYYHFHDIFDVFDNVVADELDRVMASSFKDEEAVFSLIEFTVKNKRVWRNIFNYYETQAISTYVKRKLHGIIASYILSTPEGCRISDQDLEILCIFYEEALFGTMLRWVNSPGEDTADNMAEIIKRIKVLFSGIMSLHSTNSINNPL